VFRLTFPLYVGGFLGPFGGSILVALIPAAADSLGTSLGLVATSITAYMVPFALLQLVSGTLSQRLGARRLVRASYFAYGAAALLCALAPEIWTFMAARALMGAANAFLSPILLVALSEVVPRGILGRSVGTFAAWQTAGFTLGPLLGGAIGELHWRAAFVLVALLSLALALPQRSLASVSAEPRRASFRALLDRWLALLGTKALLGYASFTAIGFVVVLLVAERFALSPGELGLLLAGHGIGGVLLGRPAGSIVDRAGRPATTLAGALLCAAGVLALPFAPSLWTLGLLYFGVGCAGAFVWAGLNTIVVEAFPEKRAGATSLFSFFKFSGVALAPLIYVPLFEADSTAPFALAAGLAFLLALLVLPWFGRYRLGATVADRSVPG
jgi:MFS family permease